MTLAKAEKLIEKARAWSVPEGLSDIHIATRLHESNGHLGYMVGAIGIFLAFSSEGKDGEIFGMSAGIAGLAWACRLLHLSHCYSQIRQLFDDAGPQALTELKSSSTSPGILPESSDS